MRRGVALFVELGELHVEQRDLNRAARGVTELPISSITFHSIRSSGVNRANLKSVQFSQRVTAVSRRRSRSGSSSLGHGTALRRLTRTNLVAYTHYTERIFLLSPNRPFRVVPYCCGWGQIRESK